MTAPLTLVASEDQLTLRKQAAQLVTDHTPASRLRAWQHTPGHPGHDPAFWRRIAELGWIHMHLTEEEGGAGLAFADLCAVIEVLGRGVSTDPWISTVFATELLRTHTHNPVAARLLGAIGAGDEVVAVAWQEPDGRYRRTPRSVTATPTGAGLRLDGVKSHVLDASRAHTLLVTARMTAAGADETLLLALPADTQGVTLTPESRIDARNAATVRLDGVRVDDACLVARCKATQEPWPRAFDLATIALSAQMVGAAQAALDMTVDYLKVRVQFGVPIGSFQALQHRAARLFVELEVTRSAALGAAAAVDAASDELGRLASLAKARANETLGLIVREAVQMHGGIGVTDEHDIGLYLKRWRGDDALLGDTSFHRARWAELGGY